ncbi:MAG: ACT domain-containing protein [Clostridiales bacterium]|nr:ACT domain-containing protein [Clostridiales bacterium]
MALPEIYHKVLSAKELLDSGRARTVSEAVGKVGLSRSAFYKYRNSVFHFHDKSRNRILSLSFTLRDEPGVVSGLLSVFAARHCNVLTLHQGLPSDGIAIFSVSVETQQATVGNDELLKEIAMAGGILDYKVLGSE